MKRGFADFIGILLTVILGLVAVMIIISTSPTIGNAATMMTNASGTWGANQSSAAAAIYPQFSTLWVVGGLAVLIAILAAVFGKRG